MANYKMQISSLSPFNQYYIHSSECVVVFTSHVFMTSFIHAELLFS